MNFGLAEFHASLRGAVLCGFTFCVKYHGQVNSCLEN